MHSKKKCTISAVRFWWSRLEAQRAIDAAQDVQTLKLKAVLATNMKQEEPWLSWKKNVMRADRLHWKICCQPETDWLFSVEWVTAGALVQTTRVYFVSVGWVPSQLTISLHCLSQQSPFGQALLDLEVGDERFSWDIS